MATQLDGIIYNGEEFDFPKPQSDVQEAPKNGKSYARKDGDWVESQGIPTEQTTQDTEEQVWSNNAETEKYVSIGAYGIKAKAVLDLDGNPISGGSSQVAIVCPDTFYVVVGVELNIYYDSLFKALDNGLNSPMGYYVDIQCPTLQKAGGNAIGVRKERMWQIDATKLTSTYVGTHAMYIKVYSASGDLVGSKTCSIIVKSATGFASTKNVLCIGDSLTKNGPIVATAGENFVAIGGTQPNFIGTKKTNGYKHEGYAGYTFWSFVNNVSTGSTYMFQVPISTAISVGDVYSAEGNQYTVNDVRTETDTTTSVRCSLKSGSATPSQTGTLTKVSGNSASESTIEYSAFDLTNGNPFWNTATSKVDFTNYLSQFSLQGQLDCAVIMLGTNDSISNSVKDMSSSVAYAKTLVNAILADSPNCKIVLQLTPADANTISSWQVYADQTQSRKICYWSNYWNLRKLLYAEFTKSEWGGKVRIGQATQGVDRFYGYGYSSIASSRRINTSEIYHTNSVHPATEGYKQFGDGYFLDIFGVLN